MNHIHDCPDFMFDWINFSFSFFYSSSSRVQSVIS